MMNDILYLGIPIQGSQGMISGRHGVRANGAPTGEILLNPVTFPVIPPLFCQVRIPGKDIGQVHLPLPAFVFLDLLLFFRVHLRISVFFFGYVPFFRCFKICAKI
jgi:hypothetical protein